ncbi:MAG: hypothetical protein WDN47_02380 [Candidatus Doudnabacteria bacterium]
MQRLVAVYASLGASAAYNVSDIADLVLGESFPIEFIGTFQASDQIRQRVQQGIQYKMILLIPSMDELTDATRLLEKLKTDPETRSIPCIFAGLDLGTDSDSCENTEDESSPEVRASAILSSAPRRMN